jgi:hypothetical protein
MATPSWTLPSNTLLATIQERTTQDISIGIQDTEDRSTIETNQFVNVEHYSNASEFYIRSTGLAQTPWIGAPSGYDTYSPRAQNYVFKIPRDRPFDEPEIHQETLGFFGVAIDGVPLRSPNSQRTATIGSASYTENNVIYPVQYYFTDGSGIIDNDRKFYYQSNPALLNATHTDGHSKIIGFAFDGNPIYGPYGYSVFDDKNSGVRPMETSYRLTDIQRVNGTIPDGSYIEDFVYEKDLGDLDQYNGRECVTPDYPNGIYAYFVTVDPDDVTLPRYPYIIGPTYKNVAVTANGVYDFPGDITLSVISGSLPPGLRVEGHAIVGTAYEVSKDTTFRFVLRATNIDGVSDRTYSITVQGPDAPIWETPAGDLPVGTSGRSTIELTKRTKLAATVNDTVLEFVSVRNVELGSIVTCDAFPTAIQANTRVVSINVTERKIQLSKSLINEIPLGTYLKFTFQRTHTNLFILDNAEINYQLDAIDNDTAADQVLTYSIPPRGGQLPPGITLTASGLLTGFVDPILATEVFKDNGYYDNNYFDITPYDYGEPQYNGYDSFLYDNTKFDYSDPVRSLKKLNRYYEFVVRVSDSVYYSDRKFRIFVVGDDFFRADDTIIHAANRVYTADATYLRNPIWITQSYLGRKRANNYVTVFLDVFDPATLQGTIGYVLEGGSLPPGMMLDQITGEIYGEVPYQPAITITYTFTVKAIRYDPNSPDFAVRRNTIQDAALRQTYVKISSVSNIRVGSLVTSIDSNVIAPGTLVTAIDPSTKIITLNKGLGSAIASGYELVFTYVTSTSKTFTIDIIGEIESTIHFTTPADLGSIDANFVSHLSIEAVTNVPDAYLIYTLVGGKIPPGLTLVNDGTLQGKVNQFSTVQNTGLTTFYETTARGGYTNQTFDGGTTTVDRTYKFTVEARDQFNQSAVTKTFLLSINTPNNLLYSNIYVKPFLKQEKRIELSSFLTDPDIFTRSKIYRPSDPAFGIQNELKMLLYPGIETKTAAEYVTAFGRSSRKRFRLGGIKKAVAKKPGTNTVEYEVIYIEIFDNQENDTIGDNVTHTQAFSVPENIVMKNTQDRLSVNQGRRDTIDSSINDNNVVRLSEDVLPRIMLQDRVLSADLSNQLISDINKKIFGNSVTNIRKKIQALGDTERNYLPLWMRTPQTRSGVEQGFTKAVPICYCLPGEADYIMLNIKNSDFDFKTVDFTVDRVIIDSVTGESGDKYIAFGAREVING